MKILFEAWYVSNLMFRFITMLLIINIPVNPKQILCISQGNYNL